MRCKVEASTTGVITFTPTPLGDTVLATGVLKRATAGAYFVGRLQKLPTQHARIIWDVQIKAEPPACVRALKPKLHLFGKCTFEKDVYYKLV